MSNFEAGTNSPTFPIEKIESTGGNSLSFSPERGGIITSLRLDGVDVLYMDRGTFEDVSKNVKGGVPILFPNFGPIKSDQYPGLPQHGIGRISNKWQAKATAGSGFTEVLEVTVPDPRYPFRFTLEVTAQLQGNSCKITQKITNRETDKSLPISMGLHPYFLVPNSLRDQVSFDFKGGAPVRDEIALWANDKQTTLIDNPGPMTITIPGVGTLELNASPEYQKIAFWALPGKDFVCVEPTMRPDNGLINDPELVAPGQTFSADFTMGFTRAS